jgi:hypothetical protein
MDIVRMKTMISMEEFDNSYWIKPRMKLESKMFVDILSKLNIVLRMYGLEIWVVY